MGWYFKYSVVGGVVIPNHIKIFTAVNGFMGLSFYCYSHAMNSIHGVELPKRLKSFMTGTMTLGAGYTAYNMYSVNKDLARMRAVDKNGSAKMRARIRILSSYGSTASLILLAGVIAMSTGAAYEMFTFNQEFEKKRAMEEEENSANPNSV